MQRNRTGLPCFNMLGKCIILVECCPITLCGNWSYLMFPCPLVSELTTCFRTSASKWFTIGMVTWACWAAAIGRCESGGWLCGHRFWKAPSVHSAPQVCVCVCLSSFVKQDWTSAQRHGYRVTSSSKQNTCLHCQDALIRRDQQHIFLVCLLPGNWSLGVTSALLHQLRTWTHK